MIININNPPLHAVEISRQGENAFREIEIDVSARLAEYPDGKISVIYFRPDGELYPAIVNATESPIVWRPTATDTAVSGVGAIEVRVQIGDVLGKSCKIAAKVLGALGAPGEAPAAPAPDWTRTVTEDADRAEAAADKAEAASTHMPQISASKTWLVWDADAGEYVDTGVSAAGAKGEDGDPGKAPVIGENGNWYEWDDAAGAYTDTGKPSRGEKGETGAAGADGNDGRDGTDGITPTIGENGNWYLGETDTGKPSRGKDGATGATGATGEKGADGKSAYAYAVDGGYTGTEAEFEAKLAEEMPDKLPNPNALTFTGSVTGSYDGSAALTVEIPQGGGGGYNDWVLLHSMVLEQDTQYIVKDLGANYNEVRICFENLWCVEGTSAGLAIAVNGGSTGLAAQCASGGDFVNSKAYPCVAIIVARKENDTFSSCTIMGRNIAGNDRGSGVFPLVYNVANGITKVQFSLNAYGTHTMNTGAIIEVWGR